MIVTKTVGTSKIWFCDNLNIQQDYFETIHGTDEFYDVDNIYNYFHYHVFTLRDLVI